MPIDHDAVYCEGIFRTVVLTTQQTRQAWLVMLTANDTGAELMPVDIADAIANLEPALDRLRRGEWKLMVIAATTAGERDAARMFPLYLLDLSDRLRR